MINPIQECNQILVTSKNNRPCPRMWSNFDHLGEWLPLSMSVMEFVHPYPVVMGPIQGVDQILVALVNNCACPSHFLKRCRSNFSHFFNKLQLKFGHVEMMGNVVLISFNSSPLTKLNISINWSLPSYCINFSTFFLWHNGFLIFGFFCNQCKELQCNLRGGKEMWTCYILRGSFS